MEISKWNFSRTVIVSWWKVARIDFSGSVVASRSPNTRTFYLRGDPPQFALHNWGSRSRSSDKPTHFPMTKRRGESCLWASAEAWNQLNDLLQINFRFLRLNEYLDEWLIEYSRITPRENGIFSGKFVPSIWVEIEYISLKSKRQ